MYKNLSILKIALAILFFIPVVSYSQEASVALGLKGGASFNSFSGHDAGVIKERVGFMGGVFLNVSIRKAFSIQPEVLFHQGGATNTVNNNTDVIKLNYADVPVLFKLRLPIAGVVYPHIFAGPDFSYRVSATYIQTNTQSGQVITINEGNIQKMGAGGVVGAGIDIQLPLLFLTVDGRYGATFTNLGNSTYQLDINNKYFTLMAGIGVRF